MRRNKNCRHGFCRAVSVSNILNVLAALGEVDCWILVSIAVAIEARAAYLREELLPVRHSHEIMGYMDDENRRRWDASRCAR